MDRGERRARTARIVRRRCKFAARSGWTKVPPGKFKKRAPVCYCVVCQTHRGEPRRPEQDFPADLTDA